MAGCRGSGLGELTWGPLILHPPSFRDPGHPGGPQHPTHAEGPQRHPRCAPCCQAARRCDQCYRQGNSSDSAVTLTLSEILGLP